MKKIVALLLTSFSLFAADEGSSWDISKTISTIAQTAGEALAPKKAEEPKKSRIAAGLKAVIGGAGTLTFSLATIAAIYASFAVFSAEPAVIRKRLDDLCEGGMFGNFFEEHNEAFSKNPVASRSLLVAPFLLMGLYSTLHIGKFTYDNIKIATNSN